MYGKPVFDRTVRLPNRGNAGGFRRHYIDSVPEVHAEACNSRASANSMILFLYKSIRKYIFRIISRATSCGPTPPQAFLSCIPVPGSLPDHRCDTKAVSLARRRLFPNCHCSSALYLEGKELSPESFFRPGQLLRYIGEEIGGLEP